MTINVANRAVRLGLLLALLLSLFVSVLQSTPSAKAAWIRKTPPLSTPWTAQVSPTNALPEYPRPQMTRSTWQNLNGEWQFAGASAGQAPPFGQTLAESILVPFPVESALSGIMRKQSRMWYRRTFSIPTTTAWSGKRVLLQFGAVDWEATVYVNRVNVGTHRGGFDAFSFDITPQLNGGTNEIIVGVYDPTDADGLNQPMGKQRNSPGGIMYTSASGIWQTVWLEPVPTANITRLDMIPDVAGQRLRLTVRGAGISGQTVEAVALNGTTQVGIATGAVGAEISLPVPSPRLWSPDDPFLYNLRVTLKSGTTNVDQVTSYFGMRTISLGTAGGVLRPMLNGKFVFQMGTLDQGYWPDGIYTAPTDAALRFDLEKHKELGFNMVRKHIKVEPQRWFYHADRLGLLVWQDMVTMPNPPTAAQQAVHTAEYREIVDEHRSSPSIVMWVNHNEGWGQYNQAGLATLVKSWDPSRLVSNQSGVNCCGAVDGGNGDVLDWHVYVGPGSPAPTASRIAVLGEYGGLGMKVEGHMWNPALAFSPYEMSPDSTSLTNRYVAQISQLQTLMNTPGLSAAVYTEIVDVENEVNGFLTYDRAVWKMDVARVRTAHTNLLNASKTMAPLRVGAWSSIQVRTPGYTDRFIRHAGGLGFTEIVNAASSATLKQDATWKVVAGLADAACYSFESRNFPNRFLRHSGARVRSDLRDGTALFNADATFCARPALDGSGSISLESKNMPGSWLRHRNGELWVDPFANTTGFRQDATWGFVPGWWRSGANLTSGAWQSFQVTTPGFTDRYLRHSGSLAYTEIVNAASTATLKQDATWRVVTGMADNSCYSFESRNFPGQFLRHAGYRLRMDPNDGTAVFAQDATFCAQPGLSGTGVSFQSYNYPSHHIRHYAAEVWIGMNGGSNAADNPASYAQDTSWNVVAPWAP